MAAYEILLLNTAIPQIQAAQSGDTYVVPRDIAFSTVANLANGTNLLPSLTFSSDTNTGIYREGADALGFTAGGGTNQMVLTSTGLGIGTNNPLNFFQLGTFGAIDGNALQCYFRNNVYYDSIDARDESIKAGYSNVIVLDNHSGGILFQTTSTSAAGADVALSLVERARISSDGTFRVKGAGTAGSTDAVQFSGSAPASAMTLDSSGNLGIGATSPQVKLQVSEDSQFGGRLRLENQRTATFDGDSFGLIQFYGNDASSGASGVRGQIEARCRDVSGATDLLFSTAPSAGAVAERARITSGGYFKASDNGTYLNSAGTYHEINQTANDNILFIRSTDTAYSVDGVQLRFSRNTTNNSFYVLSYYNATAAAYKFRVADSGDVTNTNGTYGTISDAKMKTDIVDAGSQWSDIKALRFRKFKMKDDPSGLVQLGVVAQEVELTSPGLVDEHADKDAEGNDLGTTTKSVKTSVLLMKAAVALQEAMARIEKLEAEVAALKGA